MLSVLSMLSVFVHVVSVVRGYATLRNETAREKDPALPGNASPQVCPLGRKGWSVDRIESQHATLLHKASWIWGKRTVCQAVEAIWWMKNLEREAGVLIT